jgi:hypothetical protein
MRPICSAWRALRKMDFIAIAPPQGKASSKIHPDVKIKLTIKHIKLGQVVSSLNRHADLKHPSPTDKLIGVAWVINFAYSFVSDEKELLGTRELCILKPEGQCPSGPAYPNLDLI